jgi:hypothetical protein
MLLKISTSLKNVDVPSIVASAALFVGGVSLMNVFLDYFLSNQYISFCFRDEVPRGQFFHKNYKTIKGAFCICCCVACLVAFHVSSKKCGLLFMSLYPKIFFPFVS